MNAWTLIENEFTFVDKSGAQASGGYRIVIRGSFSILLGLLTIVLFQ